MRLAIYVPKAQADKWSPDEGSISFNEFQRRIVNLTGYITVMQAAEYHTGDVDGYVRGPVLIVETFITQDAANVACISPESYARLWALLRCYASQLIEQGEESVLVVADNEPTLIFA